MFTETEEDIYLDEICIHDCLHCGTLTCPPYRAELRRYILNTRKDKGFKLKKITVCDAFEDIAQTEDYKKAQAVLAQDEIEELTRSHPYFEGYL